MLPAPAQGALAVECRAGDTRLVALLAELDDADTRAAVTAERVLLAELEAGCSAPVGAIAEVVGDEAAIGDHVRLLPTPGHTIDHLCLYDPEHGVLLSGDHARIEAWRRDHVVGVEA